MRHSFAVIVLLLVASPRLIGAEDYPSVNLKTDKLKFTLYEADAKEGFYRGTRFDHACVFGNVEFAGHKIFGPWKDTHDPTNHDDILGPCDEFGIEKPLGYNEAKAGETFLKIGVGELEKPKEEKYEFWKKYKVVKPLQWKHDRPRGDLPAEWWKTEQAANGYGYTFTKRLFSRTSASIDLSYQLKNTGEKRLTTTFYNHNFFNVDGDPIGPNYSFAFPYEPKANEPKGKFTDLVELKDKQFRFKDKLTGGDGSVLLTGFDLKDEKQRWFEMRHAPSGVRVKVEHSYPLAKLNVWGMQTTICPEPFLSIDLKPGETKEWTITYTFTHEPPPRKK
jgi:hypothetical protein